MKTKHQVLTGMIALLFLGLAVMLYFSRANESSRNDEIVAFVFASPIYGHEGSLDYVVTTALNQTKDQLIKKYDINNNADAILAYMEQEAPGLVSLEFYEMGKAQAKKLKQAVGAVIKGVSVGVAYSEYFSDSVEFTKESFEALLNNSDTSKLLANLERDANISHEEFLTKVAKSSEGVYFDRVLQDRICKNKYEGFSSKTVSAYKELKISITDSTRCAAIAHDWFVDYAVKNVKIVDPALSGWEEYLDPFGALRKRNLILAELEEKKGHTD